MLVLLSFLISRLIIRSGLRISHSKVFSSNHSLSYTRLPWHFTPIFCFCLCIHCKTKFLKNRGFYRKFCEFFKFDKNQIFLKANFSKFWSVVNLPWDHVRSQTKFGPDLFSRFDKQFKRENTKQLCLTGQTV